MTTRLNPMDTLVVDDSEDECQLLLAQLGRIEAVKIVAIVHDGGEAIAYVCGVNRFGNRQAFPYPDLLLLDFKMPHFDGMQVLEFLQHQVPRPRVVLWSNVPDQIDVPLALHLGADVVCAKPDSRKDLAEILLRLQNCTSYRRDSRLQSDLRRIP